MAGSRATDVSEFLSPCGAWASGAIVSTPYDLNAFVRNYLGGAASNTPFLVTLDDLVAISIAP